MWLFAEEMAHSMLLPDALQGVPVNIGIIPIGSGNSVALACKIPRQPGLALDIIFKGKAYPVDAFNVNEKFSCALCGIGFDADVAHEFAKQKIRGLQTYLRISTMKFFNSKPYPFEIKLDGRILKTEAYFISIANSNQFGNNVTIAPRASMSDGLLDIVIVKKMNKIILPFSVFFQVAGNNKLEMRSRIFREKEYYLYADGQNQHQKSFACTHAYRWRTTDTSQNSKSELSRIVLAYTTF